MIPLRDSIPPRTTPIVNHLLILTCVLVYGLQYLDERDGRGQIIEQMSMVPARVTHPDVPVTHRQQVRVENSFGFPVQVEREVPLENPPFSPAWTLLTCIFLHGGVGHLLGNMWSLWIFGDNVEDRLGHVRYLLFYLLCGIAASAVHLLSDRNSPIPTVGASGAIAGVMGAYLLLYPRATVMTLIPFGFFSQIIAIPAVYFLLFWFGLQFVSGTLSATGGEAGGVAWWAHIGGFATGAAITGLFLLLHLTNPKVNASRPNSQPYRRERYFAG
jgi:membrane associated rhomboid family serine protease